MDRLEQLRKFVAWEREHHDQTHIAEWALHEIERLRAETPPSGGDALYGLFRAIVDAGGPETIARHGVERGSHEWTAKVRAGLLAIERQFHPERFDKPAPPSAPVGVEALRELRDRVLPAAIRFHAIGPGHIEEAQEIVASALAQQPAPSAPVGAAEAWQEGHQKGVLDERTSEANIGIAGFNAKVEPARVKKKKYTEAELRRKVERAQRDGHDSAIRYVLGYLNGTGDCGSTMYEEILNGCGRDQIIKSARKDGEMRFTGLDKYLRRDRQHGGRSDD